MFNRKHTAASAPTVGRCGSRAARFFATRISRLLLCTLPPFSSAALSEGVAETAWTARSFQRALAALHAENATQTQLIVLQAPKHVERGDAVPITLESRLPNTESLCLLAQDNPFPLVFCARFSAKTAPIVSTRIRLASTTRLIAIARSNGKRYQTTQPVQIGEGGCGPTQSNPTARPSSEKIGAAQIRTRKTSDGVEVYAKIRHPTPRPTMTSNYAATNFVRRLILREGDHILFTATLGPSISDDPYFAVRRRPRNATAAETPLSAEWITQTGQHHAISETPTQVSR